MKKLILFLTLCFSPLAWAYGASNTTPAMKWLQMIDDGKYAKSWSQADVLFQSQVTQDQWKVALNGARTPLGEVISRSKLSSEQHSTLPGAPDGEYLVVQYRTEFANKKSSIETLTLSKSSGQWRAIGYFIK